MCGSRPAPTRGETLWISRFYTFAATSFCVSSFLALSMPGSFVSSMNLFVVTVLRGSNSPLFYPPCVFVRHRHPSLVPDLGKIFVGWVWWTRMCFVAPVLVLSLGNSFAFDSHRFDRLAMHHPLNIPMPGHD